MLTLCVRLSRNRMMYHRDNTDLALLDDPFSAVDGPTGERMFQSGVDGMLKGLTRVVTLNSHLHLLPKFDRVVVVEGGCIVADGPAAELSDVLSRFVSRADDASEDAAAAGGGGGGGGANDAATGASGAGSGVDGAANGNSGRGNGSGSAGDNTHSHKSVTSDAGATVLRASLQEATNPNNMTTIPEEGVQGTTSPVSMSAVNEDPETHTTRSSTASTEIKLASMVGTVTAETSDAVLRGDGNDDDGGGEAQILVDKAKKGQLVRAEYRKTGAVSASVYRQYFGAAVQSNSRTVGIAILCGVRLMPTLLLVSQ
jgi:hypothetical protein